MDFLYVISYDDNYEFCTEEFLDALIKKGYKAGVISADNESCYRLSKKGYYTVNINRIVSEVTLDHKEVEKLIKLYQQKYNISLRDFVFVERAYYGERTDKLLLKALRYFIAIEEFIHDNNVKCFIQQQGGEIIRRVIYSVATKNGIPCIYFGVSPFPGRMLLHSNEMNQLEDLKILTWDNALDSEKRFIEDFLENVKKEKPVIKYTKRRNLAGEFISKRILKRVITSIKDGDYETLTRGLKYKIYFRCIAPFRRILSLLLYNRELNTNIPYLYFPLHVHNDTQITIRNPQYYKQEWLIEYIARVLPVGYKLFVKPHPGLEGQIPVSLCFKLNKLDNVVLLHPDINSHDIIKYAKAIIIINSTVGYEALLYRKPVIVLGSNWTFKSLGVTIEVNDLCQLSNIVIQAINYNITEKELKDFLLTIYRCCYLGQVFGNCNYNDIADSVIAKYKRLINTKKIAND